MDVFDKQGAFLSGREVRLDIALPGVPEGLTIHPRAPVCVTNDGLGRLEIYAQEVEHLGGFGRDV